jgi:predicted XRE-type DNA-binding protein
MGPKSIWDWKSNEEKKEMEEEVTRENCGKKLTLILRIAGMSSRDLAEVLGVRESTIIRLQKGDITTPREEFMNRLRALQVIGCAKFKDLNESEKSKAAEFVGTGAFTAGGIAASIGAVSCAGAVGGLSAAGITSGLAAIGGSMVGGLALVASIPVAAGILGFGVLKGIKKLCESNDLCRKEIDYRWEIRTKAEGENGEADSGDKS